VIIRLFALVVVLALIAGTILLGRGGAPEPSAGNDQAAEDPGYAARDAVIVQNDADGWPLYQLRAAVIRQRPRDDRVELEHVTVDYRTAQGAQWRLRADHGQLQQDAQQIDVDGNVVLSGPLEGSSAPLDVRTQQLSFDTRTELASTDADVMLAWSAQQLASKGLVASLKDGHVQLESNVHGRFSPP
jgi:LPS export ABC transporter protein LptC